MKAVILAAGEGNRLKPITSSRPKPMVPLAGKPLLEHTISSIKNAGITDILLIVGYKKELIQQYFGNGDQFGVHIAYTVQEKYLGTAHATGYAEDFVGKDSFLLLYGDILVDRNVFKDAVDKFDREKPQGLISLIEVDNPQDYGIISLDDQGYVQKITEKPAPELKLGNLANAGVYIFDPMIFQAIESTKLSKRGEYEFTDSMDILIKQLGGKIIGHVLKEEFWSDIGLPWQFLEANAYLLDNIEPQHLGKIEKNVIIEGNVYIGENTVIKAGTYLQGPCYIGNNNLIGPNAFIRPYTFIYNDCHVGMSEIKNSIVLSDTAVPHFNYVGDSIICENVNLGAGTKVANLRFDDQSVKVSIKGKLVDSQRRKLGTVIGPNVKTGINVSIMCGKIVGQNSRIGAHTLVIDDIESDTLYYYDPEKGMITKTL